MRRLLIAATLSLLLPACQQTAPPQTTGREVRDLASFDHWSYRGEVAPQGLGVAWKYCADFYCAHGYGRVSDEKGDYTYEGMFAHGIEDGQGTASHYFYDYVGGFKDGSFSGYGELSCDRGRRRFEGTFVDGGLDGKNWMALCL